MHGCNAECVQLGLTEELDPEVPNSACECYGPTSAFIPTHLGISIRDTKPTLIPGIVVSLTQHEMHAKLASLSLSLPPNHSIVFCFDANELLDDSQLRDLSIHTLLPTLIIDLHKDGRRQRSLLQLKEHSKETMLKTYIMRVGEQKFVLEWAYGEDDYRFLLQRYAPVSERYIKLADSD